MHDNNMDSRAVKSIHFTLRSLVEALARLFGVRPSIRGVLNKLPTEMLRAILHRVPAHHLIRLRSVSSKWKALIEDICRDKKCLVIMKDWDEYHLRDLSYRFNDHLRLSKDFVYIQPKRSEAKRSQIEIMHLSGKLCTLLAKLFPRIQQLYIINYYSTCTTEFNQMLHQWSSTLNTLHLYEFTAQQSEDGSDFCAQINQLTNLRRLDFTIIQWSIRRSIEQLAPTLARLEHISGWDHVVFNQIVPFLGTRFYSLGTNVHGIEIEKLATAWSGINAQFASTLVRLSLGPSHPGALQFICKHFPSLQMLRIEIDLFERDRKLTTDMIGQLARLAHLTELRIDNIFIDLDTLAVEKLKPLYNIRTLSLVDFTFDNDHCNDVLPVDFNAAHFSRVVSTIFPNVHKLTVNSCLYEHLANLLEPHVNLFTNLRSYDFGLNDPINRLLD